MAWPCRCMGANLDLNVCSGSERRSHAGANGCLPCDTHGEMSKLSRRALARLGSAAAAAAALPAQEATNNYKGPLTGVEQKTAGRVLDPLPFALRLLDSAPRQMQFSARNQKDAVKWQGRLRTKVTELLGGFPTERSALQPITLEVKEFPDYRREKVLFDTRDGASVLAYLLIPSGKTGKIPAVICVPGHGRGVDDIVGIDDKGRDRTNKDGYQHDFAVQMAEAGIAAVAIEPMGFGCRRDPANMRRGLGKSSCQPVAGTALLIGQTILGWRVYDVMRTIDYIATRPELDPSRVGCMGISGGGTVTVFATALEPRIRAALVSGYLNTFRDSVGSIEHCIDNYVPGILNWAEMYDVAGLIAPRPLFIESGSKDNIFPVQASIDSFKKVSAIYEVFGAGDRAEQEVFDEAHSFWGKKGVPFLVRALTA
jgi:dienelactone hydrolase